MPFFALWSVKRSCFVFNLLINIRNLNSHFLSSNLSIELEEVESFHECVFLALAWLSNKHFVKSAKLMLMPNIIYSLDHVIRFLIAHLFDKVCKSKGCLHLKLALLSLVLLSNIVFDVFYGLKDRK
mmetsp:Transcript_12455/g.9055  ORF Transcript_12455/g.9055 Transcript_12455/m.9055 type:complete len:126 (-) Transcript_12455:66-443(-)